MVSCVIVAQHHLQPCLERVLLLPDKHYDDGYYPNTHRPLPFAGQSLRLNWLWDIGI